MTPDGKLCYSQENIDAIWRLYEHDDHSCRAIIRITASTKKANYKDHWDPGKGVTKPEFKWLCRPALDRELLAEWLEGSDAIVAVVPAFFGCVILDVDMKSDMALDSVMERYGNAAEIYPTRSGGWHCIYYTESYDDYRGFGAGDFYVGGQSFGQICSAKRFANLWSPVVFERAVAKRGDALEKLKTAKRRKDTFFLRPQDVDMLVPNPREPRSKSCVAPPSNFTLQEVIEVLDLSPDARGGWRRHCPICDPDKQGGGTRFQVSQGASGGLLFMCWTCAPHGFDNTTYERLMRSIRKRVAPQRRSMIANLVDNAKGEK